MTLQNRIRLCLLAGALLGIPLILAFGAPFKEAARSAVMGFMAAELIRIVVMGLCLGKRKR